MDPAQNNSIANLLRVSLDDGSIVSICPELIDDSHRPTPAKSSENQARYLQQLADLAGATNLYSYDTLHADGHCLISSWFARAIEGVQDVPTEREMSFEHFIFAWIAFNGWASRVTGLSRDSEIIESLSLSRDLASHFQHQLGFDSFRHDLQRFAGYWPIFSAQDLRSEGISSRRGETRSRTIEHYLQSWKSKMAAHSLKAKECERAANELRKQARSAPRNSRQLMEKAAELEKQNRYSQRRSTAQLEYAPACLLRHQNGQTAKQEHGALLINDQLPAYLDWPHTLAAIYQVRCNLFHGEKSRNSDNDQAIVFAAYRVLVGFMRSFRPPWNIRPAEEVCSDHTGHPGPFTPAF